MTILKKRLILIIKIFWLVACILILLNLYCQKDGLENKESIVVFVLSMKIITFPSGHIIWGLFSLKSMILPGAIFSLKFDIFIRWVAFVIVGYFQWFYFIPGLFSLFKKKILPKHLL